MTRIRTLIVDEFRLVCEGIEATLEEEPDIEVIGVAADFDEMLAYLPECDLVLVSNGLAEDRSLELTKTVAQTAPSVKLLVLGLAESEHAILSYLEAGANGYIPKEEPLASLVAHIHAAHNDEALVSPHMAATLIHRVAELTEKLEEVGIDTSYYAELTHREREVLELLAARLSNREIADRLTIELGTVKNHIRKILAKLNVRSRRDAASYLAMIRGDGPRDVL